MHGQPVWMLKRCRVSLAFATGWMLKRCRVSLALVAGWMVKRCRVSLAPFCLVDVEEWRRLHDAQPQPEGDAAGRTYAVHAAAASVQHNAQRGSGALSSHRKESSFL